VLAIPPPSARSGRATFVEDNSTNARMATITPSTHRDAVGPTHPLYTAWRDVWIRLAHVVEGAGGFLSGEYLIPHPREWKDHASDTPRVPTAKLLERRRLARYENLARLILDQKLAGLFREPPIRRCVTPDHAVLEDHPYLDWTADVDGAGTSLTDWMRTEFTAALIYGHDVLVLDRAGDNGPTAADTAPLVLRGYTPLDVPDWLQAPSGHLTAVKVVEPLLRTSLATYEMRDPAQYRITEITAEAAISYISGSQDRTQVDHGFGVLPVVVLYAHRRAALPVIGQSALADPQLFIDLYNLTSEIRELLRKQTFSILNIPLGTAADGGPAMSLEQAQSLLGQTTGTASVLFSGQAAAYLSADTSNVEVYQAEREALIRTIYRLCAIPYDQDSRDAESAEAKALKRADYATMLAGYADELTRAEMAIAQLWFRGTYGDRWPAEWERAGLQVQYASTFDEPAPADLLKMAQAALALPIGESPTFRVELGTKMIPTFLPDANPAVQGSIRAELEALPSPEARRQAGRDALAARLAAPEPEPTDDDAPPADEA
jgi:hypothetical protein